MMRKIFCSCAVLLALACLTSAVHAAAAEPSFQKALAQAAQSGKPILAVAARSTCPRCAAFAERLKSDAALKPLLSKYVQVTVNVDGPEFRDLSQRKPLGGGLPFVYVLKSDGSVVAAAASGNDAPLVDMMNNGLASSGRILSDADAARISAAVTKAKDAMTRKDLVQAIAAIVSVGSTEGGAAPLVEAKKILQDIDARAAGDIAKCRTALERESDSLATAVQVAEVVRTYQKLPSQKRSVTELQTQLRRKDSGKEHLEQAEVIVRARGMVAMDRPEPAARIYQQVIDTYPNTPAATLASKELAAVPVRP